MAKKALGQIIALADELNPNSYSEDIKAQWVNEVEAYIQTEIYCVVPMDVVTYFPYEENKDKELSLDAANDKIYLTYLQAMIDFSNKEYAAFNNDVALYNTYLDTYAKWYQRTHSDGATIVSGMYLSAYGIAMKHGFIGTEEEWIASLKGDKGDKGDTGAPGKNGDTPLKGVDYWTEADKEDIVSRVKEEIGAGPEWKKLFETTINEEVNSVVATSNDMSRCKEFIARVMFPKSSTGANLALGTSGWYLNGSQVAFYYATTTLNPSAITEVRTHITLAGRFIQAVGTQKASDIPALVAPANMLVGTRNAPSEITSLAYKLGSSENVLPVGTIVTVYGKVEGE